MSHIKCSKYVPLIYNKKEKSTMKQGISLEFFLHILKRRYDAVLESLSLTEHRNPGDTNHPAERYS